MAYNYHEAVKDDIREYIEENFDAVTKEMRNDVYGEILGDRSMLTPASIPRETKREHVINNLPLLREATNMQDISMREIGFNFLYGFWECFDTYIRRYLVIKYFDDIFSEFLR